MADNVPLVINQGEDFSAQIVWLDDYGNPQKLKAPMRMDLKPVVGSAPTLSLVTPDVPTEDIPLISYSPDIGLIQLHIPKEMTSPLAPGKYYYDLFVTVNDETEYYAGDQVVRLIVGEAIVNQRITVM